MRILGLTFILFMGWHGEPSDFLNMITPILKAIKDSKILNVDRVFQIKANLMDTFQKAPSYKGLDI